jgi:hypothetical protein
MLKFLLLIISAAVVVAATPQAFSWEKAWSAVALPSNGSQCIYASEVAQFSCRAVANVFVTCDAVKNLPGVPDKFFGLGRVAAAASEEAHEATTFGLYPKQLQPITNETIYLNRTWDFVEESSHRDEQVFLSLYHAEVNGDFGIRVPDVKCFKRLIEFLATIESERVVEIDSLDQQEKVSLIGEVLILEQVKSRRFLGALLLLGLLSGGPLGFGFGAFGPMAGFGFGK